jgi:hypothetical protein
VALPLLCVPEQRTIKSGAKEKTKQDQKERKTRKAIALERLETRKGQRKRKEYTRAASRGDRSRKKKKNK